MTGGGLLQESASSYWKATATNQMYSNDLEACGMKCCYFCSIPKSIFLCLHCSQVSDSGLLGLLFMWPFTNDILLFISHISASMTHAYSFER